MSENFSPPSPALANIAKHFIFRRLSALPDVRSIFVCFAFCCSDTGILEDDYFSTLGKAFIGLRLMLEAYPSKKWFVVLGDDNYVLMDNYVNVLSAFDPEQPWALSRIVFRDKFGCKASRSKIRTRFLVKRGILPLILCSNRAPNRSISAPLPALFLQLSLPPPSPRHFSFAVYYLNRLMLSCALSDTTIALSHSCAAARLCSE